MLVRIDGYLYMAKSSLNNEKLGMVKLRLDIKRGNIEGVVLNGRSFAINLIKNKTVLLAKGLKQEQIDTLQTILDTLESFNKEQNIMQSKRAQNCVDNRSTFNSLWNLLLPILQAGKAIYKGVNEAKLKDYTMTQLKKRMNNERKKAADDEAPAEPTEPDLEATK